jgi:hypothetical protein
VPIEILEGVDGVVDVLDRAYDAFGARRIRQARSPGTSRVVSASYM